MNKNNILNKVNINEFLKLCTWVYGQEKYTHDYHFGAKAQDSENLEKQAKIGFLILRNQNGMRGFEVEIYGCYKHYNNERFVTEYSISAGAEDNSLILYKSWIYPNDNWIYPLESITFLDRQYLNLVP